MNPIDTTPKQASAVTLATLPKTAAARYRDREAIFCSMTNRRFSFREVNERMDRLAVALLNLGIKKGDHCAFHCRNRAEAGEIYGALIKIGVVAIPLHWGFARDEIIDYLRFTEARHLIFEDVYMETAAAVKEELPNVKTFIGIGNSVGNFSERYEQLILDSSLPLPSLEIDSDDIQGIDTTSRTTGVQKIYTITHANGLNAVPFFTLIHNLTDKDVILTLFPLYGRVGFAWFGAGLIAGARNVFFQFDVTDPAGILKIIQQEKVTITNWTPNVASLLMRLPDFDKYDLSSLRGISFSASPFPVALQEEVRKRICPNIYEYYAMQEAGVITHIGPEDKRKKPSSVGTLYFGTDVRIVDENGADMPKGEIGQIICRALSAAPGYLKNEPLTQSAYRDGWFYTGDWGRFDEDDFMYFLGRREDMIVSAGTTVFAVEIEEAILACDGVLDCAVVGLPDETHGEVVAAVVVRDPRKGLTEQSLDSWCRGRLPEVKIPGKFFFSTMLPRSNVGKVIKYALVQKYSDAGEDIGQS